jgi:hypothetical protein
LRYIAVRHIGYTLRIDGLLRYLVIYGVICYTLLRIRLSLRRILRVIRVRAGLWSYGLLRCRRLSRHIYRLSRYLLHRWRCHLTPWP